MTARKSGNHIYIEGSGNTLQSVCDDINDIAWIEKTGSAGNYTFTVKGSGSTYRNFDVRSGGELIIGNSADYSFTEHLVFAPNYNERLRFYLRHNGSLMVYGDVDIDGSNTSSYYHYARWYGKNYWRGNDTYRPLIKHFRRIYWYWNSTNSANYTHDIWDWEHVDVGESWGVTTNTYAFFFTDIRHTPNHIFKDVKFDGKFGAVAPQYLGYCAVYTGWARASEFYKIKFEDCEFKHYYYGCFSYYQGCYYKNCTFKENYQYGLYCYGHDRLEYYEHSHHTMGYFCGQRGQWHDFVEGCTFVDNYWRYSTRRDVYIASQNITVFKDCNFNSSYRNIYCDAKGYPMIWTGNTFLGTRDIEPSSRSVGLWVHSLDLTIQDAQGNNLENVTIICRQKDGKETQHFETDSNGKIITHPFASNKAFLVWKEQTSYTGTVICWSDTSNSTYHDIYVFKDGYQPYHTTQIMSEDRSQTIKLHKLQIGTGSKALKPIGARR